MTTSCIFCKIASHEIPAKTVLENDLVLAFHDLNPQAPTHVLVIPKKHIVSISDLSGEDKALVGDVFFAGKEVAEKLGLAADGYRFVINTGKNGGQSVLHLHLHVLGGAYDAVATWVNAFERSSTARFDRCPRAGTLRLR